MYKHPRNYHKEFKIIRNHLNITNSTFPSKISKQETKKRRRIQIENHSQFSPAVHQASVLICRLRASSFSLLLLLLLPFFLSSFFSSSLLPFFFSRCFFLSLPYPLFYSYPFLSFLLLNPSSFFSFNFILINF